MKRATWILATCVVIAAGAFSFGLAQERSDSGSTYRLRPPSKRGPRYFPRKAKAADSRKSAAAFPAATRVIRTETLKPKTTSSKLRTAKSALPNRKTKTSADSESRSAKPAGSGKLIHADYRRGDATSKTPAIQQVGVGSPFGETTSKTRAAVFHLQPPVPEIGRPVPVRPAIRRTSLSVPALIAATKIPTGDQSPTVTVSWVKSGDINVGQECLCYLIVKNSGSVIARDLLVETNFPATVRLTKATPAPSETRGRAVWRFRSLAPGQEKKIEIKLIPSRRGPLSAKAAVRFTGFAASDFTVKEPMLKLDMTGAAKVMVGDSASQIIVVSNPGTGIAKNVSVEAWIPKGLEHSRGDRLVMSIGSLNPGESRKVRLSLTATNGGEQTVKVKATADATLARQQQRTIQVAAPSLKVAMAGPGLRYVGRNAVYKTVVSNDGSIPTNNVRVVHKLPEGFKFLKADKGGSYNAAKRTISWFVGRIESGKKLEVTAVVAATKLGKHVHRAGAISEQSAGAETTMTTNVEGTASLVVEIADLDDPVEVGAETAYEVRVRNAGSKSAVNVQIACELPPGVELVGAKGPSRAVSRKGSVIFDKVAILTPGATAIFRVHVRGKTAGNQRFRARLTSDTITKPLTYDEITKFYSE
ncbi:MAG: hypothetical protein ACE5KM_18305 [Planctomycetaceae bacterium]